MMVFILLQNIGLLLYLLMVLIKILLNKYNDPHFLTIETLGIIIHYQMRQKIISHSKTRHYEHIR